MTCPRCGSATGEFGLVNWDKHQDKHVRNPRWIKLDLGFFDDPVVAKLSGAQQLAFISVLILCGKRANRVPFDADYIKKRCDLRIAPDLLAFMAHGLIAPTCCSAEAAAPLDEKRQEEMRGDAANAADGAAITPVVVQPSKPSRGKNGTEEQRRLVDEAAALLGVALTYSKSNVDAVVRASRHYTPEQVRAVLESVRDASTPSGRWCNERISSALPLAYILRPGEKGAADKILQQLAVGAGPADVADGVVSGSRKWAEKHGLFGEVE